MKKRFLVIFLLMFQFVTAQRMITIDSLTFLLKAKKINDTTRINTYNLLSWEYRNADLRKTDSFANIAVNLATPLFYYKGMGNAYVNKGFVYKNSGDYEKAIQTYRWALVYFVKAQDKAGYSSVYNNVASVYYLQGNYAKAQYYYFQSLDISEELQDGKGAARSLNNIGVVYMEQRDFDRAIEYFQKAYDILEKEDANEAADCLNNIGSVYQYKGDTNRAIINYRKSMEINKRIGDKKDVSSALNNIGLTYYESGNYKLALDHYHQSLQIDEELGDIRAMVVSYGNIANSYIQLGLLHTAQKYAQNMLAIALKHNIKTYTIDAYEMLNRIEEANGNYKEALEYHKLYKAYSDSVYNDASLGAQKDLEARYLKEKAEKERLIQTRDVDIKGVMAKEKEKEVSRYILLIGMVLLLFVLVIYVVFFLLRRNKYS